MHVRYGISIALLNDKRFYGASLYTMFAEGCYNLKLKRMCTYPWIAMHDWPKSLTGVSPAVLWIPLLKRSCPDDIVYWTSILGVLIPAVPVNATDPSSKTSMATTDVNLVMQLHKTEKGIVPSNSQIYASWNNKSPGLVRLLVWLNKRNAGKRNTCLF